MLNSFEIKKIKFFLKIPLMSFNKNCKKKKKKQKRNRLSLMMAKEAQ